MRKYMYVLGNFTDDPYIDPCESNWQGLKCKLDKTSSEYKLLHIELSTYSLKGTIPRGFFANETSLVEFIVDRNHIHGK